MQQQPLIIIIPVILVISSYLHKCVPVDFLHPMKCPSWRIYRNNCTGQLCSCSQHLANNHSILGPDIRLYLKRKFINSLSIHIYPVNMSYIVRKEGLEGVKMVEERLSFVLYIRIKKQTSFSPHTQTHTLWELN